MIKNIPTFSLLSIGHRGVGKSVFLAGTYADVRSGRQADSGRIRLEGANDQTQAKLEELLDYMEQTGQYPPPTLKMTDFTFRGTPRRRHDQTLFEFRWVDVPGEICRSNHPDFEAMLLNSHGCCLFIDAVALVQNPNYLVQLEEMAQQAEAMASLVAQSGLKYLFALILTKCDLLPGGSTKLIDIEQKLRSLTTRLDAAHAVYRQFYSSVSIISSGKTSVAVARNTSAPFSWMLSELYRASQARPLLKLGNGCENALLKIQPSPLLGRSANLVPKALAALGIAAVGMGLWFGGSQLQFQAGQAQSSPLQEQASLEIARYEKALKKNAQDGEALLELVDLYREQEQYESAVGYLERLIILQPGNLNLYFSKADLYAAMNRKDKEEAAYDEVLAQQNDNVTALTN
ncbi:MAG: tetratricopeptide repeat protein, partial [Cyanobacteria bacterium P01_A01_bin.17]